MRATNKQSFGERLRSLREARGLTPEALGAAAGLHSDTVRKIERGDRQAVSLDTAARLADALGVPLDELAGRMPPGPAKKSRKS